MTMMSFSFIHQSNSSIEHLGCNNDHGLTVIKWSVPVERKVFYSDVFIHLCIMHRRTIVQNRIISIICSCFFS